MPENAQTYVATEDLFLGRARAATEGERFVADEETIRRNGWTDHVEVADQPIAVEETPQDDPAAVLAEVGDDKKKASAALAAERKRDGGARPELVESLEQLVRS